MLDEDFLLEVFDPFGRVRLKRMFGGRAIYLDGLVVALEIGEVLYLKADALTEDAFRDEGLDQFLYEAKGRTVRLPYWRCPEAAFDDAEALRPWIERARSASLRAEAAKAAKEKAKAEKGTKPRASAKRGAPKKTPGSGQPAA